MEQSEPNIDDLLKEVLENPEVILSDKLTHEQINSLYKKLTPYNRITNQMNDGKRRLLAISTINNKDEYLRRFIVTSFISFMYTVLQEWEPAEEVRKDTETSGEYMRRIVKLFLDEYLSFDPSVHVKSASDTLDKDLQNELCVKYSAHEDSIKTLGLLRCKTLKIDDEDDKSNVKYIISNPHNYNSVVRVLTDPDLAAVTKTALDNKDKYIQYLTPLGEDNIKALDIIPPQDTFHKYNYYTEVNYEKLRKVTECLYPELDSINMSIMVWNIFTGESIDDTSEQFSKFCEKYSDEFPTAVKAIEPGKWYILTDCEGNRSKLQFYNKHNELLKRMMDRHEEDKKLGKELLKNRVKKVKSHNISTDGPDDKGLSNYDQMYNGREYSALTLEERELLARSKGDLQTLHCLEVLHKESSKLNELEEISKTRKLTSEEEFALNNSKRVVNQAKAMLEVPDNALQLDVYDHNCRTGTFKHNIIYTAAEDN